MTQYRSVKMHHPVMGHSYGIIGEEYDASGKVIQRAIVPNISCDCQLVSHLAARCTAGQLALDQLLDVIYDTLS